MPPHLEKSIDKKAPEMGLFLFYTLQFDKKSLELYMKKIVIKEIDKYKSSGFKNKTISEYLIYVLVDDNQAHSAYTVFGEEAKKLRVNSLILERFMNNNQDVDIKEIIEEHYLQK